MLVRIFMEAAVKRQKSLPTRTYATIDHPFQKLRGTGSADNL
jgi:hypothetical protein